ncbi:MAG: M28 family peptidase [Candidatus Aminicenantes bacterium]|nr:MAG: M28 family peptidase [Candidatus Aminicenantes bacterium]
MMKKNILFVLLLMVFLYGVLFSHTIKESKTSWQLLKELVLIPGVSGYEGQVADFIQSRLPQEVKPQKDEMQNLWFTVGSGRPHLVFVAHTDELGFVVEGITPEGLLKVSSRGGFLPQMYEGHAVEIHTKTGIVGGIVAPRPNYFQRNLEISAYTTADIAIYLGVSSQEEVRALGVSNGDSITIRKKIVEFSPELLATRAVDDRAGCAALLEASCRVDWTKIENKTITFAWDVQEETGLFGASHLAVKLDADYVFPVDTFVSSAGPFDSRRFAHLPLGKGAVLRAIDSSNIAPYAQLKKVIAIARANKIPIQLGNTRGGNDGSVFVPHGAVDIPLSWPGTYSHSFIEKIHRADLEALTDLIAALVRDWE